MTRLTELIGMLPQSPLDPEIKRFLAAYLVGLEEEFATSGGDAKASLDDELEELIALVRCGPRNDVLPA